MFFFTIGDDGSRQCGSDALIFIWLLQQKSKNISSIHIGKNLYLKNKWFLHFANLLKHSTSAPALTSLLATTGSARSAQMPSAQLSSQLSSSIDFTIGDDGIRQVRSESLIFIRVLQQKSKNKQRFKRGQELLTEKQMVLALCQFTEAQHMFFLTMGGDGSRQCASDALIFIRLLQQKSKKQSRFKRGKNLQR